MRVADNHSTVASCCVAVCAYPVRTECVKGVWGCMWLDCPPLEALSWLSHTDHKNAELPDLGVLAADDAHLYPLKNHN